MRADQAAGLRRRAASLPAHGARQPQRSIHLFSDAPDTSLRLAHALHQTGHVLLLVDATGRLFSVSSPRSLFDWPHQLERRQLHTVPQAYGEGWYAPGVRADEAALSGMVSHYDYVMFDAGWGRTNLALPPGVAHRVVMEVRRTDQSMQHAYAVLKTLACQGSRFSVGLLGDRLACDHVRAAGRRFLEQRFARAIYSVANEDDAFAALAVRMAEEETSLAAC